MKSKLIILLLVLLCLVLTPVMGLAGGEKDSTKLDYFLPEDKQGPTDLSGYCYMFFFIGVLFSSYFVFKGIRKF